MKSILAMIILAMLPATAPATKDCQWHVIYGIHAYKLVDGSWIEIPQGTFIAPGLPVRFRGWVGVGPNGCEACCADLWFQYVHGTPCGGPPTYQQQRIGTMPTLGPGEIYEWFTPTFVPQTYLVQGAFYIEYVQSAGGIMTYAPRRTFYVRCWGDVTSDLTVNVSDLLTVINNWGNLGGCGDATIDGIVNYQDLLMVIENWGPCYER